MRALMLSGPRQLDVVDVPLPEVRADEVLIRVAACGICGSDVHGYDLNSGRRIPPLVMGHEGAGIVAAVGGRVTRFAVGDRLTFDSTVFCGECAYCRRGSTNLCLAREVFGVSTLEFRRHGAFAEYVAVPERICIALPPEIPLEHAAMIEAAAVALHAVSLAPPEPDATAVVVGAGVIGALVVQALRVRGVRSILAVDQDETRLAVARSCGATHTVNFREDDPVRAARDLTDGLGATCSYEVVGSSPALATAIEAVERGGHVTLIGNVAPRVDLPLQLAVSRQLSLHGACASSGEYGEAIALMRSGAIDVDPLVSVCAPLDEGAEWFDRLYKREPGLMKVLLQP
jgi:L-iditol 2-dehydrogenase